MAATHPPGELAGLTVGILGGTGGQGRGLARRFSVAGLRVVLGSRDEGRAEEAAAGLRADLEQAGALGGDLSGSDNAGCARQADLVVVAVPWDGHAALLGSLADELAGTVVVDCVNPLGFDARGAYPLPVPEGSACEQAQRLLPGSTVVGAFHHLSAVTLLDPALPDVDSDVLVTGDDRPSTDLVQALAEQIPGVRGLYAGRLRVSHAVEALTANVIAANRRYKAHAGVRLTLST